jgi:hypothetical protein
LTTPDEAQLQTLATWTPRQAREAWLELCWQRAALSWCGHCRRLVTAGCHDSDWRRQFWQEDETPAFLRHVRDLLLLRQVECAGAVADGLRDEAPSPAAAPPLPPAAAPDRVCGLKELPPADDEEWEWTWEPEGNADVGPAQEGEGAGGR